MCTGLVHMGSIIERRWDAMSLLSTKQISRQHANSWVVDFRRSYGIVCLVFYAVQTYLCVSCIYGQSGPDLRVCTMLIEKLNKTAYFEVVSNCYRSITVITAVQSHV